MKGWICKQGHKNDADSVVCFLCGGESTVKIKESLWVKKNSDKRAEQMKLYLKKAAIWKKGKICLMCDWEGKNNTDVTPHHQQGRGGDLLLDFKKIVPLCLKHHVWVTEHSKEAIELGISLPRNSNNV